jgi:hypothetical protein
MRVLFTCNGLSGHFHPLVPFARALADAGHEVAVATRAAFAPAIAHAGFRHFPAGLDRDINDVFPQLRAWRGPDRVAFVNGEVFAGVLPRHMVPDLLALARAWPPDLIVREGREYGGCIAAEVLGLPHAAVGINASGDFAPRGDRRSAGRVASRPRPAPGPRPGDAPPLSDALALPARVPGPRPAGRAHRPPLSAAARRPLGSGGAADVG